MLNGSCLCGAIAYAIERLDKPISHCHCLTCQKAHAAAFASTAGVLREHFRWLRGEDKLSSYESSPGKLRRFCSICGTQLVAERAAQAHVIVRVATLDQDPGARRAAGAAYLDQPRPTLAGRRRAAGLPRVAAGALSHSGTSTLTCRASWRQNSRSQSISRPCWSRLTRTMRSAGLPSATFKAAAASLCRAVGTMSKRTRP